MRIVIPKEIQTGEKRVATTPDITHKLVAKGFQVWVESHAGMPASFSDDAYREAGAKIVNDSQELYAQADIVLKVRAPQAHPENGDHELDLMPSGCLLICFLWPAQNAELLKALADKGINAMSMDAVPRISRAQKLDALSSMANIAGYRSVIEASNHFGRFFTGQITAAGKVPPAKVMVIGAGVAGLAAIGTAKSLGAIVRAFDTRPEVKDQILSMDAEFLELDFEEDGSGEGGYAKQMSQAFIDAEMALFAEQAREVDIIITTALIPGKPAPKLITEEMVKSMKQGSVIVDLAAEQGGNCELTKPHRVSEKHGVTIIGFTDMPSRLPAQASQLYGTNLLNMLDELIDDVSADLDLDFENEVIRGSTVVKSGEITWPPPAIEVAARQPAYSEQSVPDAHVAIDADEEPSVILQLFKNLMPLLVGALTLFGIGAVAPPSFMGHFTVFILSCFIGYMVIWNVTPSLHTPLMSVTNAISSIIIIGALIQVSSQSSLIIILSAVAILIATINIVGGFAVTQRMLKMFGE
ncbi:MAG: Re/Si-specific NAD(P)(+) transhydrogenase subunit alpha [Gammaproteobacteria bacterium]|nr:Re/Si-specific NAD(P)(+) transhydrogenase subunit alpha [Gammaproteobacteria bacterium]